MKTAEGYKLIPMSEITDEAREIAVAWMECDDKNWIGQKHKLASDIMNYASKYAQERTKDCYPKEFVEWFRDTHDEYYRCIVDGKDGYMSSKFSGSTEPNPVMTLDELFTYWQKEVRPNDK